MRKKVTVGQKLYSLNVGNNARHREQVLTPVTVVTVGRKYFTTKLENYSFETYYRLDDWSERTEYSPNSKLYESEQEWADEKETMTLCKEISRSFEHSNNTKRLSLQTLRTILAAITHDIVAQAMAKG